MHPDKVLKRVKIDIIVLASHVKLATEEIANNSYLKLSF